MDFTGFDLASISGSNGAGKSSLLDAMTWALFGQARKRDESVINLQSKAAEVAFTFAYEANVYRVIRSLQRGKSTTLEFQILDDGAQTMNQASQAFILGQGSWRPLTEHTLRETQARIEQTLRLDYDTFINVSFFLQGKADQFAQQPPTRRKEILGNILGLETWEVYKERAANHRKDIESRLDSVDGRVAEIDAELGEEESRKAHLAELEKQLKGLASSRKVQEEALASVKQVRAALDKQRELVHKMDEAVQRSQTSLSGLQARLAGRVAEREPHADLLRRAAEIEAAYTALQKARRDLEKWDQTAERFREHDQLRQPLLREIESEQARLEEERRQLEQNSLVVKNQQAEIHTIQAEIKNTQSLLTEAEAKVVRRLELEAQVNAGRERQAELRSENISLKAEMDELKERIAKLTAAEGAACPLCGQSLTQEHRQSTLELLNVNGKQLGDRWRANTTAMKELTAKIADFEPQVAELASAGSDQLACSAKMAQLTERLEAIQKQAREWESGGGKRLVQLSKVLESGKFALEARKKLALKDKDLAALGYDAAAHDAARRAEVQARPAEAEFRGACRSPLGPQTARQ